MNLFYKYYVCEYSKDGNISKSVMYRAPFYKSICAVWDVAKSNCSEGECIINFRRVK